LEIYWKWVWESAAVGTYFGGQCAANGVLVRVSGDIIMIAPPLIISADEVHQVIPFQFNH
jgi:adenosylmethionine-8-amino-7-oxononanoate aminotransferase